MRKVTAVHEPPTRPLSPPPKTESVRMRIDALIESPLNPRKVRGEDPDLEDLAASIAEHDIIEPIVARPSTFERGKFEIIAGHRRHRAAKRAGREDVPVIVRDVTDVQLLELAFTENTQRRAMHALDEAEGLAKLQQLDPIYRDNRILAGKIGRSETYVRDRLKLLKLAPVVREALDADAITAKHAERIARLPVDVHESGLAACFSGLFSAGQGKETRALIANRDWTELRPNLRRLDDLDEWIEDHVKADIADTSVQAELGLVPQDLGEAVDAAFEQSTPSLLQLSEDKYLNRDGAKTLNVIPPEGWKEVAPNTQQCPFVKPAAVVHGGRLRLVKVCTKKSCEQHWPKQKASSSGSGEKKTNATDRYAREQEKREAARAAWEALQPVAKKAFAAHGVVTAALTGKTWGDIA